MSCPTGRCRRHSVCSACVTASLAGATGMLRGRRLSAPPREIDDACPGDYWLYPHDRIVGGGCWYVRDPSGRDIALRNDTVVEHDDGTITLESLIVGYEPGEWTGRLERGVWIRQVV